MTKKALTFPTSQNAIKYMELLFEKATEKNQQKILHLQQQQQQLQQQRHPPDINIMEALLSQLGDKRHAELDFLEEHGLVTTDMFKLLNVLYYKLRHHDREYTTLILNYIFSMRVLSLDDLTYPEMSHVKFSRNDVVWFLWRLLILYADRSQNPLVNTFVRSNMIIFSTSFQKKNREPRIQILYHVYQTLSKKEHGLYSKELKCASDYASYVVDAAFDVANGTNEDEPKQHPLMTRKKKTNANMQKNNESNPSAKANANANANDDVSNDDHEKFDYLKMFTRYPTNDQEEINESMISTSVGEESECALKNIFLDKSSIE
jgi:hypothetical protein